MSRRRGGRPIHGWLNIDKEPGMTSTQVVGRVRRLTGAAKVGHGGTLDPLATGVLPVALGEATKTVSYVMDAGKVYRFTVRWGEARDTDDAEGAVTATSAARPTAEAIRAVLPGFIGEILQVPPDYSAIKVAGRRAYDLARRDEPLALAPRTISVTRLTLLEQPDTDHAVLEMECGKGAYVRALVRDMAVALGTVGHVVALRRIRVGPFVESDALTLAGLEALTAGDGLGARLMSVDTALADLPAVVLDAGQAQRLKNGQVVRLLRIPDGVGDDGPICARFAGRVMALAEIDGSEMRPIRVFNF